MTAIEARADLCAEYIPFVYGGDLDEWTYVQPGAWRGDEWPCKGGTKTFAGERAVQVVTILCSCPCHTGALEHELPPRRTAVHPTEVPRGG